MMSRERYGKGRRQASMKSRVGIAAALLAINFRLVTCFVSIFFFRSF